MNVSAQAPGGDALPRASVGQHAKTKCNGCNTCVTSSKTYSPPINMRLVTHATETRPFFLRHDSATSLRAGIFLTPLTGSENGDVSWRFFTPCPQNPSKKPPKIPIKYPFNSSTIFPRPANPLASNQIRYTLGAERPMSWRRAWLKMDPKTPENTPPRLRGRASIGVESQLQLEEA